MKNLMKCVVLLILVMVLAIPSSTVMAVKASSKNITTGEYIELLMKAMKVTINETENQTYITAAVSTGVLKTADEFKVEEEMTRTECAVLTNRADIYVNGVTADTKIFDEIKDHKRISDLSKISKEYRDDVVQVFGKGIIVGYTNGKYTQDRAFKGSNKITYNGAKAIINKITNKKLRSVMSPDGQLTRTTKLPCNAKEYEYILASFPNKFYEMMFRYEWRMRNKKWENYHDYCVPANIKKMPFEISGYKGTAKETQEMLDKYLDMWVEKIETNIKNRFNVDYRSIDEKWYKDIRSSYCDYSYEKYNERLSVELKEYIKAVKKNKVVIKTDMFSVESSTLYVDGGFYIRCYIKFKVTSASNMNGTLIFGQNENVYMKNLEKNKWHEGYYDISIGTTNGTSFGDDYAVFNETIGDGYMKFKDHILKQRFNNKGDTYFPEGYYYWD
ncbi:MAG TPA: hypothetical protein DCE48_05935 [Lachnospiraceae bacterium]|nr:hypothetical protein [Lachnospiraceae bacterium]